MKLSIVIPALNESEALADTLAVARQVSGDVEIIVVNGASSDSTVAIARAMGATVVTSPSHGRAAQMNLGAGVASGDALLFLHADTRLPPDAWCAIADALASPRNAGGCFRLRFDDKHIVLTISSFLTRFRCRLFHFGDSAYFLRRSVFERLGGFRPLPIMEDLDFWLRLTRSHRTVVVPSAVVTSARRFRRHGVIRQQALGALLVALFVLGVETSLLRRIYQGPRVPGRPRFHR